MQNNKVLKRLLTVATVAAMFSAFGVHAQTSGSSGTTSASGSGQDATTMQGKTTREGTAGNTGSRGKDERMGGAQGGTSSQGAMGSSAESAANPAVSGTSQGSAGAGATTREGTVGNTGSQGMESRQPGKAGSSSGMSSGMSSGSSGQGATAAGGAAAGATKSSLSKSDEKILKAMAQANIAEIEAGKMAQSKSQNEQVKSFAQQMIDDHGKALTEVQALAQQKGVTLPTEPDAKHKAMATKLQAMSGDAFDKAYMAQAGVADHKKVHSMLLSDEKRAKDPDVKAAAAKMAPVVEQHLKSAEQMHSAKSGTTSGK